MVKKRIISRYTAEQDSEIELVIDEIKIPRPLDDHIASLILRTPSNYKNEGYDLTVSAHFGSERVTLHNPEFSLNTVISIKKAEIQLKFYNSEFSLIDQESTNEEARIIETFSSRQVKHGQGAIGLSAHAKLSDIGLTGIAESSGSLKTHYANEQENDFKETRERRRWHHISPDKIEIMGTPRLLNGLEIDNYTGWRVIPKTIDQKSGVIGHIKIREDWIEFSKESYSTLSGKIGSAVSKLIHSKNNRRKTLFSLLLKHLVYIGLQTEGETRDATIATSALILRPNINNLISSIPTEDRAIIEIPTEPIEKYLSSDEGQEVPTLIALGVPPAAIPPEPYTQKSHNKEREKIFIPRSSPISAAKVLKWISENENLPRADLIEKFGINELRDLTTLNLVKGSTGGPIKVTRDFSDEVSLLKHSASSCNTIRATRSLLISNPKIDGSEIAEAIGHIIGKEWTSPATKKRSGNALRRWTLWLEPYLINSDDNPSAHAMVQYAQSKTRKTGAPTKITPALTLRAKKLLEDGLSRNKIAKKLGISVTTLRKILKN